MFAPASHSCIRLGLLFLRYLKELYARNLAFEILLEDVEVDLIFQFWTERPPPVPFDR